MNNSSSSTEALPEAGDKAGLSSDQVLRQLVRQHLYADEASLIELLVTEADLDTSLRARISQHAESLVNDVRGSSDPALLESFLAEYGLSTDEGVALMCLAEALLRVPDSETVDALIHDKITPADWGRHLGQSSSSLVNASTWALMLTGSIIADEPEGIVGTLRGAVRRLGEPVVRTAVNQAIREMGNQFVLGEDIEQAIGNSEPEIKKGFTYSYDMLGEAALTDADARQYHLAYSRAVAALGLHCTFDTVAENPGISVKLSALYPRYEFLQKERVMVELVARTRSLAMLAKSANMGFNIDAEEADRLDLSLDVIEAVLSSPGLAGWDGFGIVVQAYSKRASFVIDWLYDLAVRLDRKIMVRLVKGAYWDTEIKRSQVGGFDDYPVFTRKSHTDISYLCCAHKLLGMVDRIYPQFATHNAHTVAAVHEIAQGVVQGNHAVYEFQRLHGMGDTLHRIFHEQQQTRCRIYAPVGAHEDLLAYLVRRLLENGANSSFVNQIVDKSIEAAEIAADPFDTLQTAVQAAAIAKPHELYAPNRLNSKGFDITDPNSIIALQTARQAFANQQWLAAPMQPGYRANTSQISATDDDAIINPATGDVVGYSIDATVDLVDTAFQYAGDANDEWRTSNTEQRAACLLKAADLFEENFTELVELTCREAGKNLLDSVAEIREAVDFLRYYADEAQALFAEPDRWQAKGTFVCISPWNFPLAIFSGQIAAAVVTGNCVIAKPAEPTPLIAARAVALMHEAGIPEGVLQLLTGSGSVIGNALVSHPSLGGVCFTGSTATATRIHQAIAEHCDPDIPLIAETGGINAMIVDSSALPEQAVSDIVESAFQSAGQRCSALRLLCVQDDIYDRIVNMLKGAMDMLVVGEPASLASDVGPLINKTALQALGSYCEELEERGQLLHKTPINTDELVNGHFLAPALFSVDSVAAVDREMFGPLLHIMRFKLADLPNVVKQINAQGYGLTFGLHTRVDERVQQIADSVEAGNLYINRNQIGAIVGSQPFGGKGLSGTGPKAGGPHYLLRFVERNRPGHGSEVTTASAADSDQQTVTGDTIADTATLQAAIDAATSQAAHLSANENHTYPLAPASRYYGPMLIQQPDTLAQLMGNVIPRLESLYALPTGMHEEFNELFSTLAKHYHETTDLPGPTGESNRLSMHAAGTFVCLSGGSTREWLLLIMSCVALGNAVVLCGEQSTSLANILLEEASSCDFAINLHVCNQQCSPQLIAELDHFAGVCAAANHPQLKAIRQQLAARDGEIIPLVSNAWDLCPLISEVTLCIDTTAAGGNAKLLAESVQ